jgi:hypothetical protein
MSEQWPLPQAPARPALPSVEDLPRNGDGYDPDGVQEAFDAFYRHIARLDATLRTLEAVDAFSRQATELRDELRAVRRARWEESWNVAYGRPAAATAGLPRPASALPRIATEVAFLIAVAVFLGVGSFRSQTIVVVMAASWLVVGLVEFIASRSSGPSFAPPPELLPALPPSVEAVHGWQDDEGLTMVAELEPSRRRWFRRGETEPAEG